MAVKAVKQGMLAPDQVQECLDIQRAYSERGQDVPLWKVLVAKKFLSKEDIVRLKGPELPKTVTIEMAQLIPGFKVIERIGEGGVATVFRAFDQRQQQTVAMKVLFPIHATNQLFVDRFRLESELMIQFSHKNLVKGYAYGSHPLRIADQDIALHYLVMELVEGQSVQDDLNANGFLEEPKALHIILQIAEALDYLQQNNSVHRDIKPDNILYDRTGAIKLCDLGFAKEIEDGRDGEVEETTCGTVQYISPEQARGLADVDIRADIYSLGATLYHLVVGEVPFAGNDSMEVMAKQVLESLESDKYRKRGLSPFIGYFIEKMMAKERDIRYQTPAEAIDDIQKILDTQKEFQYDPENDPSVMRSVLGGVVSGRGSSTSMPAVSSRSRRPTQRIPKATTRLPTSSLRNSAPTASADAPATVQPNATTQTSRLPLAPGATPPPPPPPSSPAAVEAGAGGNGANPANATPAPAAPARTPPPAMRSSRISRLTQRHRRE